MGSIGLRGGVPQVMKSLSGGSLDPMTALEALEALGPMEAMGPMGAYPRFVDTGVVYAASASLAV